ncbi:hypothetical protein HIM_07555 [Hirsutella minnesotensis 3608]|uniref:Up-regulated in Daf-2 domain-containing protein n=1 Tax=Hirsutella minnesotensis 3608 TaxID=1043627 RepID=A0A0F7ZTE7_9HYPO|nr:hypothetical protein HIM_07555 [Hirsutella minnesotensis 3608]
MRTSSILLSLLVALAEMSSVAVARPAVPLDVAQAQDPTAKLDKEPPLKAFVVLRNNSSRPLVNPNLKHKHHHHKDFDSPWDDDVIPPGQQSPKNMTVHYDDKTWGLNCNLWAMRLSIWFFLPANHCNWWRLSYFNEDRSELFFTDPLNFREWIDKLEYLAPKALEKSVGALVGLLTKYKTKNDFKALAASVAVESSMRPVTDDLFNQEPTVGFKQHTLTKDDADLVTVITVSDGGRVTFSSTSGESSTVISSLKIPLNATSEATGAKKGKNEKSEKDDDDEDDKDKDKNRDEYKSKSKDDDDKDDDDSDNEDVDQADNRGNLKSHKTE